MEKDLTIIKDKRNILLSILLIKALYVLLSMLYLPDNWKIFDYDRNIHAEYLIFELLALFVEITIYLKYYHRANPISFLTTVLFCIYIIPVNSTLSLSNYDSAYYIFSNLFCVVLLFMLGLVTTRLSNNFNEKASSVLWSSNSFLFTMRLLTLMVCIGTFIYFYIIQGGFDFSSQFDEEMYEKRADFADYYLSHTNGFMAYFIIVWRGITSTILLLCLFAALKQKRIFDIMLVLFSYFLLFALSMEKSTFMQPFIVVFIYFAEKKQLISRVCKLFVNGYVVFLSLAFVEKSILGESAILFDKLVLRLSYMPSYLNHTYYTYYQNKPKIWLTSDFFPFDRLVRMIIPPTHPQAMVQTISDKCFDGLIPSPNTGLFAESYAQMGLLGILFFPVAIAIIARVYAIFANNYGLAGAMILLSGFAITLTNTAVFSTMGMVRLIIFIIITWVMVKPITQKKNRI